MRVLFVNASNKKKKKKKKNNGKHAWWFGCTIKPVSRCPVSLSFSLFLSFSLSLRSNNAIFLSSLPPLFGSVPSTLLAGCWWVGLACFRRPRGFFFLVFRSSLVNLCTGDQLHVKRGRPFSRSWGAWVSGDGRRAGARQPPRRAEEAAPQETRTERREARGQGIPCPCLQLARVVLQPWNVQIRWVFFRPARNFLAGGSLMRLNVIDDFSGIVVEVIFDKLVETRGFF